jgi:hypothetical protein
VSDGRDRGSPPLKAWEEFRASYSAALLHAWLLEDLEEIRPDYFDELQTRIAEAILTGEELGRENAEEYGSDAPIQGPEGKSVTFLPIEDAYLLEEQLFPHSRSDDDYKWAARGLAAVGLHASLATYFTTIVGATSPKSLPEAVRAWHKQELGQSLESELSDALIELDETRNIVVHNRGVVSDKYVNNVPLNRLHSGERKPVSHNDLRRYAGTVWDVANKIRKATIPAS